MLIDKLDTAKMHGCVVSRRDMASQVESGLKVSYGQGSIGNRLEFEVEIWKSPSLLRNDVNVNRHIHLQHKVLVTRPTLSIVRPNAVTQWWL